MSKKLIHFYLLLGAYQDGKTKKIKNWYLWIGGILGLICKIADILQTNFLIYEWIFSLIPGIGLLICSKAGKERIGSGDGWILLILGSCYSQLQIWPVFCLSMMLVMVTALILLLGKRVKKETQIPYLPFLCLADIILWGVQYVS